MLIANKPDNYNNEPSDQHVKRCRIARLLVFGITAATAVIGGHFLGKYVLGTFYPDVNLMRELGGILGFGIGTFAFLSCVDRFFIIRNNLFGYLITQDSLATLFGGKGRVLYGPGFHISFPWEIRDAGGNIVQKQTANDISFKIQCLDGLIEGSGSYLIRPDMALPMTYLTGVGAVESGLKEIIVSAINQRLSTMSVLDALTKRDEVEAVLARFMQNNEKLDNRSKSEFEAEYGVQVDAVKISELLPTGELSRTMTAVAEAKAIFIATAESFGLTPDQAKEKLENKLISQGDWSTARDRILSVSGNLEGMVVDRQEYDVNLRGLDGDAIKNIAEIVRNPALQQFLLGAAGATGGKRPAAERLAARRGNK